MSSLNDFHFLRPLWLITIPIFYWLIFSSYNNFLKIGNWENLIDQKFLIFLSTKPKNNRKDPIPWLISFTITLFLIALAGPVWEKTPKPIFKKSHARVIVLDLSYSMLSTDIKPTRIDRVRYKIEDLLKKIKEGKTGLICYAGDAFVISPLTNDPATIISMLPGLNPEIMPLLGSNPERAIKLATELFERSSVNNGHIIWITDGIEEESIPKIEKVLNTNNLSILAVGTETGSPIALTGGGFLKDYNGSIVIPKLDKKPLIKLAKLSSVTFSVLSTNDNDLEKIVASEENDLNYVEDKQQRTSDNWEEEGPWLLLIALPISALFFRRGILFSICFIFLITMSIIPIKSYAFDWNDLWLRDDQIGARLFEGGKMKEAVEKFKDKEWKGAAFYRSGDYENAIKNYSQLNLPRVNYNLANSLAMAGRLKESLELYNKILQNNPEHKDANFNKELIEKIIKEQDKNKHEDNKNNKNQQDALQDINKKKEFIDKKNNMNASKNNKKNQESKRSKISNDNNDKEEKLNNKNNLEKNKSKNEHVSKINKKNNSIANKHENNISLNKQHASPKQRSKQQLLEQWLRKIPDDPGRLLRNKMQLELKRRGKNQIKNKIFW